MSDLQPIEVVRQSCANHLQFICQEHRNDYGPDEPLAAGDYSDLNRVIAKTRETAHEAWSKGMHSEASTLMELAEFYASYFAYSVAFVRREFEPELSLLELLEREKYCLSLQVRHLEILERLIDRELGLRTIYRAMAGGEQ